MIVEELYVLNFLSFREATLKLPAVGLVLLTGWDEDLGRANGAGKSSLFQALSWCLYGKTAREGIKVGEIVRRGEKKCQVSVKFSADGISYQATRKIPSGLEVKVNGEPLKGAPAYLQEIIANVVGLNFEQFLVTSYFPQKGDESRFLRRNDVDAKNFLGNILGFSKIDSAHEKFKGELKELSEQLKVKNAEIAAIDESISRFQSLMLSAPEKPDVREAEEIKADRDKIATLLASPPDTTAMDKQIDTLREAQRKVMQVEAFVDGRQRYIADTEKKIRQLQSSPHSVHVMSCPSCSADLVEVGGRLVEHDESSAAEAVEDQVSRLKASIEREATEMATKKDILDKMAGLDDKLDQLRHQRMNARQEYDLAQERHKTILARSAAFQEKVKAYQREKKRIDELAEQVASLQAQKVDAVRELEGVEAAFRMSLAAKEVTSPTGAIAYSLDEVIQSINDETASYLDVFSHNTMTYRLATTNDKGKVVHSLSKGGVDVSVASLSGGEDRGLVLSVDLGLSDVIAERRGTALPSILMLDECTDGLDHIGKEKVIDALREVARNRCIVIIDHSSEMSALFDNEIKVVKRNDVSEIVL